MISLIEMIFGSKLGRWLAEILLIAVVAGGAYLAVIHKGKTEELARLKKSSIELIVRKDAEIQRTNSAYAADVKTNQEKLDAATAQVTATNAALARRVRDFDAYRRSHPDVARPAGSGGAAAVGECGAISCGDLASRLAVRGDELARSTGGLAAVLQSCQRDRDALTGLPKEKHGE